MAKGETTWNDPLGTSPPRVVDDKGNPITGKIFAVDFDGVLFDEEWPLVGAPREYTIKLIKQIQAQGNKTILNTCREGKFLVDAIIACNKQALYFDAYNENLPERIAQYGGDCRKISADYYIDDKAFVIADSNDKWLFAFQKPKSERVADA